MTRADGISVREVSAAGGVTRSIHPVLLAACVLGCVGAGVLLHCVGVLPNCVGVLLHCVGVLLHCVGVLPNCVGVLHCVGSDVQAEAEDRMSAVELARTTPAQL